MVDPRDSANLIYVREAKGRRGARGDAERRRKNREIISPEDESSYLRELEELDVRNLDSSGLPSRHERRSGVAPSDRKKIFQVLDPEVRNHSRQGGEDVQIWRLDDETRREETYHKVGGSEILSLDNAGPAFHPNDPVRNHSQTQSLQINPTQSNNNALDANRKSYSDVDLSKLAGFDPGGEFYTAIGPDGNYIIQTSWRSVDERNFLGKEIILRRYLNEQVTGEADPYADRGFLNMAIYHLQNQEQHPQNFQQAQ